MRNVIVPGTAVLTVVTNNRDISHDTVQTDLSPTFKNKITITITIPMVISEANVKIVYSYSLFYK